MKKVIYSKLIGFVVLLIGLSFSVGGCTTNEKPNDLERYSKMSIDSFFQKVRDSNYKGAINGLLAQNENIDLRDSSTISLVTKFENINFISGSFKGYSIINSKLIGNDLGVFSCLAKYEKKFYRFVFVFYNNSISIKIYKFSFDDDLDVELQESIKPYVN